jgi:hypothetical protein
MAAVPARLEDPMHLAISGLASGSCLGDFSWNPATIGSGESTFSGVLAGFVFAGIVGVLGVSVTEHRDDAASALKLLFCSFLGLLAAAYLLVGQSADENCVRTVSEGTLFGGILGTSVILMLVALSWLVAAYDKQQQEVLRFLRRVIDVGGLLVTVLLCTSAYSYLRAAVPRGPAPWTAVSIYLVGLTLYVLGVKAPRRSAFIISAGWTFVSRSAGKKPGQAAPEHRGMPQAVDVCAWAALSYLLVAAGGGSAVLATTSGFWDPHPLRVIYLIAWSSVVAPLAVLVCALHARAPEATRVASQG